MFDEHLKQPIDNTDNASASPVTHRIEWSPENELILVEWCDAAQCYKWLNTRAHSKYSYMHAWFTIPTIVLSTVSGTASFAQASLPISAQIYAPMAIGTINIFIGILTTVQQYLKISELNESHRVSAISWDKFARNIRIELAKAPGERMDAKDFIKLNRQEFDRLMETSPSLSSDIIDEFNRTFRGEDDSDERKRYDALKKPDICNIIVSANENRHHWYKNASKSAEEMTSYRAIELEQKEMKISQKETEINRKEHDALLRIKEKTMDENRRKQEEQQKKQKEEEEQRKIDEYITMFETMYGRKPIFDEIYDHLEDSVGIELLDRYRMDV